MSLSFLVQSVNLVFDSLTTHPPSHELDSTRVKVPKIYKRKLDEGTLLKQQDVDVEEEDENGGKL